MLRPTDFFDLDGYEHKSLFFDSRVEYVWDALKLLGDYLDQTTVPEIRGQVMEGAFILDDKVYIAPGSEVEPGAVIKGPTYIGANTQVRQGAYVRGNVLVGDNCVVGHSTEIKNSILLNNAHAAHLPRDVSEGDEYQADDGDHPGRLRVVTLGDEFGHGELAEFPQVRCEE